MSTHRKFPCVSFQLDDTDPEYHWKDNKTGKSHNTRYMLCPFGQDDPKGYLRGRGKAFYFRNFESMTQFMGDHGFHNMTESEILECKAKGESVITITIDDGEEPAPE